MATSYAIYKKEITDYLKLKFDSSARILDVGAGAGTWLPFLHPYFTNIDAVEIFKPNIDNYDLENRYVNVYNVDIKDFKYDFYDIIIFGDIIEHLDIKTAQSVLKYAYDRCNEMIVAVPYLAPQGIEEDNIYEIHKQDDLTNEIMKERYPYLINIYKNDKYGYYTKEGNMKNYLVKALKSFDDYEGKEIKPENTFVHRNLNDEFHCTRERYEYLKEKNAVVLLGIDKKEDTENIIPLANKEELDKIGETILEHIQVEKPKKTKKNLKK